MSPHYVTYCDDAFAPLARLSISSALQTQRLDRLTILYPGDAAQSAARLVQCFESQDQRVQGETADALGLPGTIALANLHPHLYTDVLRSYLYDVYGRILWFDADILMLEDISDILALESTASIAAAPDPWHQFGDYAWQKVWDGFVNSLDTPDQNSLASNGSGRFVAINCGLLFLNSPDIPRLFGEGLTRADRYFKVAQGHSDIFESGLTALTLGQLAWNYAFARLPSAHRLSESYNWAPPPTTDKVPVASRARPPVRIVHYVGAARKRHMTADYATWFSAAS